MVLIEGFLIRGSKNKMFVIMVYYCQAMMLGNYEIQKKLEIQFNRKAENQSQSIPKAQLAFID